MRDMDGAAPGDGRGGMKQKTMPMKLPTIRRQPLSAEQVAHLAEIGRIQAEGQARRELQAAEREAAAQRSLASAQAAVEIRACWRGLHDGE